MPEKRKTITYESDDGSVKLTVVRANTVIGMERSILQVRGIDASIDETREAARVLRSITYPDLIAPTVEAEGRLEVGDGETTGEVVDFAQWPLPFEQFAQLPDDLIVRWEHAVYTVNPHWNPAGEPQEALEKKEPS